VKIDRIGTLAVLANVCIWGSTPVLLKDLTQDLPGDPWTANGIRYPIAAVLLWPTLWLAWRRGELGRRVLLAALVPAVFAFVGQILWAAAPYYIQANAIGFFIKASTIWAVAGAMLLFPGERLLLRSRRFGAGMVLAVAGLLGLAFSSGAFSDALSGTGILVILSCGLFFGFYGVSIRYFMQGISPMVAFGVVAQYVSIGTVILMGIFGIEGSIVNLTQKGWILVVSTALFGVCISHIFFYVALLRLGASITSSFQMLSPFLTYLVAALYLGESMTGGPWAWVSGVVLVTGGLFLLWAQEQVKLGPVKTAQEPQLSSSGDGSAPASGKG
jgi:drug/metabolite transporter (DMT)-like permease